MAIRKFSKKFGKKAVIQVPPTDFWVFVVHAISEIVRKLVVFCAAFPIFGGEFEEFWEFRISDMNDQENVRKIMDDWVPDILTELESDNSRLFKEEILRKNLDNETLKRVLKAALDPYTQYYQRKIPKYSRKEDFLEDMGKVRYYEK